MDTQISVSFHEGEYGLKVEVNSVGPLMLETEMVYVFDRGFRGEWARKTGVAGDGIGLHFAKWICDLHGFSLDIDSDRQPLLFCESLPYAHFKVSLHFPW